MRMERYKIIYIWKSLNGHVPSLDFKWKVKDGTKLIYPKVHGPEGRIRTLQRFSLRWEGVRLFNCIPQKLRMWKGSVNTFKNLLDKFLEKIPDQPQVNDQKPRGMTVNGDPSNSIPDWVRILSIDDINDNHDEADDDLDDDGTTKYGDDTPNSNSISCIMGSGLSLDHC